MSNRNEITIVSQMFYPDTISTAKVMTDIAEGISDEFVVKVICQDRSYVDPAILYEDSRLPDTSVEIDRVSVPALNKNKMVSRFMLSVAVSRRIKSKLIKTCSNVYLAVSNPPNLPVIVGRHARKTSSKFIYLLHDLYPDVLAKLGYLSPRSPVYSYLKSITRKSLELADAVVVLGRDAKDYLGKEYGISNEKIEIVPNWIPSISVSSEIDKTEYNKRPFNLVYAGNIGETAEVELLLKAMKEIEELSVVLYIVGGGKYKNRYEKLSQQLDLRNVIFTGYVGDSEFEAFLSKADAFVVSLKQSLYGISVPSKTYHYLKYDKPILGLLPENSEIALLIEETASGMVCSDYTVNALANTIRSITEFKGHVYRSNISDKYSKKRAIASLKRIFRC